MATRDSISVTKARLEELKRNVEAQRARRDEYSAIISQQSLGDLLLFYWLVGYTFRVIISHFISCVKPNEKSVFFYWGVCFHEVVIVCMYIQLLLQANQYQK